MLQQTIPEKVTIKVIAYFSDESRTCTKACHCPNRISGRTSVSQMRLHPAEILTNFQELIFINQSHTSFRELHLRQNIIILNDCQCIDQSIAQSNYFIHLRYFFCKDIAYFKISYYFCSAFEKKQHSSLAQSVRASDC